jgi:hypothetical protein
VMQMRYYRRVSTFVGRVYAAAARSEWHFALRQLGTQRVLF